MGDCTVFNLCCHILAARQLLRGYENFMVDLLPDEIMVTGAPIGVTCGAMSDLNRRLESHISGFWNQVGQLRQAYPQQLALMFEVALLDVN